MKQPLLGAALVLVGMGLGATVMRDQVPSAFAQTLPPATPPASTGTPSAGATGTDAAQAEAAARTQNERNTVEVVRRYEPGLVFITTEQRVLLPTPYPGLFAGQVQEGLGSGFFVNSQGDILTNYHVVAGQGGEGTADRIFIRLLGQEETVPARVIGVAPQYDLALIRAEGLSPELIRPIPLGDSDALAAGQKAIAMGAPFGLDFSVSEGIVSSAQRQVPIGFSQSPIGEGITQNAVQTDAAINPGNSGGPLLDSSGRVIGINTQILSPSGAVTGVGQSAGVGFAVPINTAKDLLPRLQRAEGGVVGPPRVGIVPGLIVEGPTQTAAVGLSALVGEVKRELGLPPSGLLVGRVLPDSPAAEAGLRGGGQVRDIAGGWMVLGGDIIVGADGRPVDTLEDLQAALLGGQEGDSVTLRVLREGQIQNVQVTLDAGSFQ